MSGMGLKLRFHNSKCSALSITSGNPFLDLYATLGSFILIAAQAKIKLVECSDDHYNRLNVMWTFYREQLPI